MKRFLLLLSLFVIISCKNKNENTETDFTDEGYELLTDASVYFQPLSSVEMEEPDSNAVKLGKHLFYDTRLSGEGNISCNSCHNLNTYGVDNRQFSPGDVEGTFGNRNSPTVLYAALHKMQFWDGRAQTVEEQAAGPILNPIEHNIKQEEQLVNRLKEVELYQDLFTKAYGDEGITFENALKAIGAFERTLMPKSRFDSYLEGDHSALTEREKSGLKSFINAGCITCHSGVAMGGQMFQKFGLYEDYWKYTESETIDLGLYEISQDEMDKYFFKVPGLRNIEHTYPYFHDGSVEDLNKAVEIMVELQTANDLSETEIEDIVAFLKSLSADVRDEAKQNPFE
ncbi:c-type cytochrome [Salinimicrobium sp. MT39]|jgi:cytochrome c peroxidase|uniref:C-type cytochrome n=1 Tax=Salinimicrobium profundisediminis TaxID=2994553 RepID=A0A9X3CZB9_9FLAO|nr:cytochrome c peroxidase [Salinimicrobium profundisediminis]MCX2839459.1 c-type cytochrome [Salinimicrobium profundisediminis]